MTTRGLSKAPLLLALLALSGCYFGPTDYPRYPDPPFAAEKGVVMLFVGLTVRGQDLTSGMDIVTQDLHRRGISARSLAPEEWQDAATRIAQLPGAREVPVAAIGYSVGGSAVTEFAEALKAVGIPVQTLVVIEGWPPSAVPCNVRKAIDVYSMGLLSGPLGILSHGGRSLGRGPGFSGELQQLNLSAFPDLSDLNHFNISWSGSVRRMIEQEVLDGDRVRRQPPVPGEGACFARAPA